ncbi:N-acetylmuramoyl-L-alanine amidase family protein [Lacicoccus qingdaonensis]|uniref:N-acetylmuramoyl-L-alanine amidase n=1 Tax=Lacicoccus qingdaonensis TaxID=576118 RepID=A0A1G9AIS2_9BACL|nr:N-acetylmuramoyl-L-alanine amidase [Salinicoccus qingdaonensis]SDK27242.1 N-acetylmuramoyl-L-alanine amidase [Salinicoccus qingdaonensis]
MNMFKRWMKQAFESTLKFLKYRKSFYMIPLFFMTMAVLIVSVLYFLFQTDIFSDEPEEETESIVIDFDQGSEVSFNGETIVIDPGHGGKDPGAPSVSGKTEAEIVYSVAEKTADILESNGANVEFTRGQDEFASLDERKADGDLFISLHSDAMEDPSITGFTTFYTYDNQKEFAETMNDALDKYSNFRNRGTNQSNYQVTWQLDYPATLIELGYLSNEIDDRMLSSEEYQDLMAQAISEGIYNYLN